VVGLELELKEDEEDGWYHIGFMRRQGD